MREGVLALLAGSLTLLAACGGGSDDAREAASNQGPPAAPAATADSGGTCDLPNFRAELLGRINAHRAAGADCASQGQFAAVAPLAWRAELAGAALVHSEDMATHDFVSHTGSDGRSVGQRATAAGYAWRSVGENVAAGQVSVADVVAAWMGSAGHCANVMNADFRDIALACVPGAADTRYRRYWTMTLGEPR
jgi:uncharacterized protein YkwD